MGGKPEGAAGTSERRRAARVCIVGFMAAGKSTVARELARRLSCRVIDLDDLTTARTGRTPQQLIDEEGEAAFRVAETDALGEALEGDDPLVVALGGGAWTLARNRALVAARDGLAVWLDAPFELCWRRITDAAQARPLARDEQRARRLYEERRAAYALASLRVPVGDDTTPETLSAAIADALETDEVTDE